MVNKNFEGDLYGGSVRQQGKGGLMRAGFNAVISGLVCALIGMLFAGQVHAQGTLEKIRASHVVRIGYRDASVPFSYLDGQHKPIGYAIDLCLKVTEALRRELHLSRLDLEYVPVTSANRIAATIDGKIDLECGSTTNNAERRRQVAFTIPHFIATVRMLVRSGSAVRNWTDLRGRRVVTTRGTTTVKLIHERSAIGSLELQLVEGSDHVESLRKVEAAEADAFPMDDVLLFGLRANASHPERLLVVGDALSAEPYAIMMRKDDASFKRIVDREMARLIDDGELQALYEKWFQGPIPPKHINLNMPMNYLLRDALRFPTDKVGDGLDEVGRQ